MSFFDYIFCIGCNLITNTFSSLLWVTLSVSTAALLMGSLQSANSSFAELERLLMQ